MVTQGYQIKRIVQKITQQEVVECTTRLGRKITRNNRKTDPAKLNQINEDLSKRYEKKYGNFNQVFPFNKITENLAIDAYKTQTIKSPTKPDYTRLIVNEIKKYIQDFSEE